MADSIIPTHPITPIPDRLPEDDRKQDNDNQPAEHDDKPTSQQIEQPKQPKYEGLFDEYV